MFTVYGMVGFMWVVLLSALVSERPAQQQALLLQEGKGRSGEPGRIPYRAFATCLPLWAIILVETSHGEPSVPLFLTFTHASRFPGLCPVHALLQALERAHAILAG